MVSDFDKPEIQYDVNVRRHRSDTLRNMPMRTKLILLGYINPDITRRSALQNLTPTLWSIAREEPGRFAASPIPKAEDREQVRALIEKVKAGEL